MLMRSLFALALTIPLFAASTGSAATLNVVGGRLLGASDVNVGGDSYNVVFLDGTCIDLYSGCDDVVEFTFQSESAALLASQALLDQVFLDGADLFDSDPELTAGCESTLVCAPQTPYGLAAELVITIAAENWNDESMPDGVLAGSITKSTDLAEAAFDTYAVWTLVPEPGTAVLMGLGLLGLSVRKRREV